MKPNRRRSTIALTILSAFLLYASAAFIHVEALKPETTITAKEARDFWKDFDDPSGSLAEWEGFGPGMVNPSWEAHFSFLQEPMTCTSP